MAQRKLKARSSKLRAQEIEMEMEMGNVIGTACGPKVAGVHTHSHSFATYYSLLLLLRDRRLLYISMGLHLFLARPSPQFSWIIVLLCLLYISRFRLPSSDHFKLHSTTLYQRNKFQIIFTSIKPPIYCITLH